MLALATSPVPAPALAANPERFVAAMGLAATAVSVVTTDGPAGRFGITVSAISSVSAEPALVLACINRKSPAVAAIVQNGVFCINMLAAPQRHVSDAFAGRPSHGGVPYDFACADWTMAATGAPVLARALCAFDCALASAYDEGSHRLFIGRVLEARTGGGEPLVYSRRGYRRLADLDS